MNNLARAIKEERWEAAALYLVLGMARAIESLGPETVEAMLDLIEAEEENAGQRGSHRQRRTGRGQRRHG
ncbi:MAG: hypothetical protein IH957_05565 [Chloroflexi bacterium]|nr:hypothetical protein [Chloroflexota bacterium]